MALIFKWYFVHTTRLAMCGSEDQKVDYQIHCGPAMGAFNQWVKGTELQSWRKRHVAKIGAQLMQETAMLLTKNFQEMARLNDDT
jgi:trans-AT polyketide synthase/acyltransferase/oxidoreductase domain-containing protein